VAGSDNDSILYKKGWKLGTIPRFRNIDMVKRHGILQETPGLGQRHHRIDSSYSFTHSVLMSYAWSRLNLALALPGGARLALLIGDGSISLCLWRHWREVRSVEACGGGLRRQAIYALLMCGIVSSLFYIAT
jgi:hypothetical protein